MRFRMCVALLVMPVCVSAASLVQEIPIQFRGEWNAHLSDCGHRQSDSALRLGKREIVYYESSGPVRAVVANGKREIAVIAELSGEGEQWVATEQFKLSADQKRLESVAQESEPFVRYRCPRVAGGAA